MKIIKAFLHWADRLIGVILVDIILILIPAGLYALLWWFIPKNPVPVICTSLLGIPWLVIQIVWVIFLPYWRADLSTFTFGSEEDMDM